MRNIYIKLILVIILSLAFSQLVSAQDEIGFELDFDVNRVSSKLTLTKEKLNSASSLIDLNARYKEDWVKEYISVTIIASNDGVIKKVNGIDDTLTLDQKKVMRNVDAGTDISVIVKYLPENNLIHNEIKHIRFSFNVDPDIEAQYAGGLTGLNNYLRTNAFDKVLLADFSIYNLTAIRFAIDEAGQVFDAQIAESSNDDEVDSKLLSAICNMPAWIPAQYADGTKVKRDFVFTIGDHRSCTINVLDIVEIDKFRVPEE